MRTLIGESIKIYNPTDDVRLWVKKNLALPNPTYAKKKRMGFWTGNTPQELHLYEESERKLTIPFGCLDEAEHLLQGGEVEWLFNEDIPDVEYGARRGEMLYGYQATAVAEMIMAGGGILNAPAGSGKTQMGIALFWSWKRPCLWITHTKELLKQSMERAARYIPEDLIGTITEGKVNIGTGVTFATIQTLSKLDLREYRDLWDVIICDECHHLAGSAETVTMYYGVLNSLRARHKYGLTATAYRADGLIKACFALIGGVKYIVPDEAVSERIMKVDVHFTKTGVTESRECLNSDGTVDYQKMIDYLVHHEYRNLVIMEDILTQPERPCIVLSSRVEHLRILHDMLPLELMEQSAIVHGKQTSKRERQLREEAIEQMRTGEKNILFATYQLAREGLDIPRLEKMILATPQKDKGVIIQSLGRVARVHIGKTNAIAYDYADDIGILQGMTRKRISTYRKEGCRFV